jgi:hypothetical protein
VAEVATVEVIAVAAVVIAAEIATNASRGGKTVGKTGNRVKGNRASLSNTSSYSPFTLLPFSPFISSLPE